MKKTLNQKPRVLDSIILSVFAILITLKPFWHGDIDIFEVGLYLPGINEILHGGVPYRDVFHLRGPFEIYIPAFVMKVFGAHLGVLYNYFYFGNILCIILCIWIGRVIIRSRAVHVLMVLVLIGRAWPRVTFMKWGGMRYAFGLLAVGSAIAFFKTEKKRWIILAGVFSACSGLTSIEMGFFAVSGVIAALLFAFVMNVYDRGLIIKAFFLYLLGALLVVGPFVAFMISQGAFVAYLEAINGVILNSHSVIDQHFVSVYPRNLWDALAAMVNPASKNFRHLSPAYLYVFMTIALFMLIRDKRIKKIHVSIVCLAVYGFTMYAAAFRSIWASQFEMALQPEKILYFYFLEFYVFSAIIYQRKMKSGEVPFVPWKKKALVFFLLVFFIWSIIYPIRRYNKRFYPFQAVRDTLLGKGVAHLHPVHGHEIIELGFERAKGIKVSAKEGEQLEQIVDVLEHKISREKSVFIYPELGTYNFFADRDFYGRFPIPTFTWFYDPWHEELMGQLQSQPPDYVVLQREMGETWKTVYLAHEANRQKYQAVLQFIQSNYQYVSSTPATDIYKKL